MRLISPDPHRLYRLISSVIIPTLVLFLAFPTLTVRAAGSLTSLNYSLSNEAVGATNVTHTLDFSTATLGDVLNIAIEYKDRTTANPVKPAGLDLTGAILNSVAGTSEPTGWTLDTSEANIGTLNINRVSPVTVAADTDVTISLNNIINSNLDDCQPNGDSLSNRCYIRITTYNDNFLTPIDSGDVSYIVREDPTFTLDILGVDAGETHNGVTTNMASTGTRLDFQNLVAGTPKFMAHKLVITTNAPHGYRVYAYLQGSLDGTYNDSTISPFGGVDATWSTPQSWSSPFGTLANHNSGWFGANTSDARVTGWAAASNKFGPISSTPHIVAQSNGSERSGFTCYVSYAIEINQVQPADQYSGNIIYDIRPVY